MSAMNGISCVMHEKWLMIDYVDVMRVWVIYCLCYNNEIICIELYEMCVLQKGNFIKEFDITMDFIKVFGVRKFM